MLPTPTPTPTFLLFFYPIYVQDQKGFDNACVTQKIASSSSANHFLTWFCAQNHLLVTGFVQDDSSGLQSSVTIYITNDSVGTYASQQGHSF